MRSSLPRRREGGPVVPGDGRAALSDALATGVVFLAWSSMLVWAQLFVDAHASPFPVADDALLWTLIPPLGSFTWSNLWEAHSDHRMPLTLCLQVLLQRWTGGLRAAMHLEVLILGTLALGWIVLMRRVRGRTSWTDAVFPLLLLHTGNARNLLMSWQVSLTLPTALVCLVPAAAALSRERLRLPRALACSLALLALPLCGGAGVTQAPALAAWTGIAGASAIRGGERGTRRAARLLLLSAGCVGVIVALYFLSGSSLPEWTRAFSWKRSLVMCVELLALALGPAARTGTRLPEALVTGLLAATLVLLVVRMLRDPRERLRAGGILASIAGTLSLAAGIALSRAAGNWQAGFAHRYVTLTVPALCAAYLAWTLYGGRHGRRIVCGALALAALAALPGNARHGWIHARTREAWVEELRARVRGRAAVAEQVAYYSRVFLVRPEAARRLLGSFAAEGRPPYDHGFAPPPEDFEFPTFSRRPVEVRSAFPPVHRVAGEALVLLVEAPACVRLRLAGDETSISGSFGASSRSSTDPPGAARVVIEKRSVAGDALVLLDRLLEPASREQDRGLQRFRLEIPPGGPGELVLLTQPPEAGRAGPAGSCWSAVVLD